MNFWINKNQCTGCGACVNACPKKAIIMKEDNDGFLYPCIDNEKCINCGLCKKSCPIIKRVETEKFVNSVAFAGWSKNENTRFTSTSGGLFTELTLPIIKNKGYVVGACYNSENIVQHKMVDNIDDLQLLKQSKYLQSDTKNIYLETRKKLESGKIVSFCGSPCQIAGLYKFLKKDYNNLLTIEFICRGVNSPKAYKSWLSEIEFKENKKVKKVWFKYKINGWKTSPRCTRVDFDDNSFKVYNGKDNTYMSGYLDANLYIRPSCGNCQFNGLKRQADITLADFWGIKKELDDDKGTSLILINSSKGMDYFNSIKSNIFYEERKIEEIYFGNACFNKSIKINKNSSKFLSNLNDTNFSKMVNKYSKRSIVSRITNKIKQIYKKIKL